MILENIEALSGDEGAVGSVCPGQEIYATVWRTITERGKYYHFSGDTDECWVVTTAECNVDGEGRLEGTYASMVLNEEHKGYVVCNRDCLN